MSSSDWFGEILIIDDNPQTHDVWTMNEVNLIRISKNAVVNFAQSHPILLQVSDPIECFDSK
ncbi:CRP-like cAMP-binding protein [Psychrobacter sp. PL15]|uniref:hypothetical protein n=1 Tax=unclassified Psychrobacter TaxID=196806 RepID=UPI001AE4E124|nr:hypothetical protein [Psychrobacter sp. PL15]MEC5209223.1 CRP-like cAMP-binding protein [Psychrobacter sp. PL15]